MVLNQNQNLKPSESTTALDKPDLPRSASLPELHNNSPRFLTFRSLLVAFAASVLVVLIANYHDGMILRYEVSLNDHLAPLALGLTFLLVLTLNGLVRLLRRSWGLSAGELAVALTLMMVVTPVPRFFANQWVGTVGYTPSLIDAKDPSVSELTRTNLYQALPPQAFLPLSESRRFDRGLTEKIGQMAPLWPYPWNSWSNPAKSQEPTTRSAIPLPPGSQAAANNSSENSAISKPSSPTAEPAVRAIPWRVWIKPLLYWAPLLLTFLCLSVSFGLFLYRQWALRELVPFPLAEFSVSLIRNESGRAFPDAFYNTGFWIGFCIMVFLFGCNGLHNYFERMIEIPVQYQYYELSLTFPFLRDAHDGFSLVRGFLYFSVIAVAVILPSEISFTSWFIWPVMVFGTYFFFLQTGRKVTSNEFQSIQNGAWWAMAVVILYTGRNYYLSVLCKALAIPRKGLNIDRQEVWVFRLFLLSAAVFTWLLVYYGLPWDLAIIWTICLIITLLVSCRLAAEMGISWLPLHYFLPMNLLTLTLGSEVLGRKAYALFSIFSTVTTPVRTSCVLFTPAVANAAHIENRITGRNESWKAIAPFMLIILLLSIGVSIWYGYSSEGSANDYHTLQGIGPTKEAATILRGQLAVAGTTVIPHDQMRQYLSENQSMGERWGRFSIPWPLVPFIIFGMLMIGITSFLRLKFPRFPLHPLPMILLATWLLSRFWINFMIGWMIKKAILKIGGGRLFERCRPFFTGIIVGQATIFVVWVLVNILVYWNNNYTLDFAKWRWFFRTIYSS